MSHRLGNHVCKKTSALHDAHALRVAFPFEGTFEPWRFSDTQKLNFPFITFIAYQSDLSALRVLETKAGTAKSRQAFLQKHIQGCLLNSFLDCRGVHVLYSHNRNLQNKDLKSKQGPHYLFTCVTYLLALHSSL